MSARDDYQGYVINQGQSTGTENRPPTLRPHSHHLPADVYDAAMDEIDRLRAECQLQRNLLGNATGAALDVGLSGGVTAHDAIYLLAAERDALKAENVELVAANDTLGSDIGQIYAELLALRLALVKWNRSYAGRRAGVDDGNRHATVELFNLIPAGEWGLGAADGEPEQ